MSELDIVPVGKASYVELREYQRQLKSLLVKVESALSDRDRLKAKRHFNPISSSLPNRRSNYFLERIGAFRFSPSSNSLFATGDDPLLKAAAAVADATLLTTSTAATEEEQPTTAGDSDEMTAAPADTEKMTTTPPGDNSSPPSATADREKQEPEVEDRTTTPPPAPASEGHSKTPGGHHNSHAQQHGVRTFFDPIRNHTVEECKRLTQEQLVTELKQRGTYNPDLMAYDISGVLRFLDRSIVDQYERQVKSKKSSKQAVWRNVEALEKILSELNLHCDVRTPEVVSKIGNLTVAEPRRSVLSPSIRMTEDELRYKRHILADDLVNSFNASKRKDDSYMNKKKQKLIGDVHIVPFGCDKRGDLEDGYLRLCGACQAIRKLPDSFFPPFINEVMCDTDKACLYFYSYAHGKCKQKHMNFVVLRNVGTPQCQIWQKFNLNVRVSCECFVDEMSFFAKYV